jgi:hypothetical protein
MNNILSQKKCHLKWDGRSSLDDNFLKKNWVGGSITCVNKLLIQIL